MSQSGTNDDNPGNFVDEIIADDVAKGVVGPERPVQTRFPPEPNGYLHIGHAKAVCLNFEMAKKYGGRCNLRFDDTNPSAEKEEFVDAIKEDIRWLGYDWGDGEYFASDYFEQLYEWAEQLIREGKAYVDSRGEGTIRATRGDFHKPGTDSPFRERSVEENLDLFRRMRAGEFEDGAHVLRAKIDMQSPDLKLRDPVMYRIRKTPHHRTGDRWCIYPLYDWAHGQSDAIEHITHSLCSLEYVNHHALYDWFLEALSIDGPPRQFEFARLALTFTVLSKRMLHELVGSGQVSGWDDPRMPTLAGLRRRGYTPKAIRSFCDRVGVARSDSVVDVALLEHAIREDLNATSPRVMAVLRPLKVVIENFEEGRVEEVDALYNPEDPQRGSRKVPLSRTVWVERDDFMKEPPKKWWRLGPGKEVRLRYGCLLTCDEVVEHDGEVVELRCHWDPKSLGGNAPDGRKVRGTLHWVSADHALDVEVRQYDRLFAVENPTDERLPGNWLDHLNPNSVETIEAAKAEPSLSSATAGERFQFERIGYYCVDLDSQPNALVFNRTIALKDSWAKLAKKK